MMWKICKSKQTKNYVQILFYNKVNLSGTSLLSKQQKDMIWGRIIDTLCESKQ